MRPALGRTTRASFQTMYALTKISLLGKLAYPHDIWGSLLRLALETIVFWRLWIALYAGRELHAGVTLEQALAYQVISVIVTRLFTNWITWDAGPATSFLTWRDPRTMATSCCSNLSDSL
jgi:ABC-type uncharacterized transport system permease subunit